MSVPATSPPSGWRWPVSVVVVVALHGAALLLLRHGKPDPTAPMPPLEAVLLDLTPVAPAPSEPARSPTLPQPVPNVPDASMAPPKQVAAKPVVRPPAARSAAAPKPQALPKPADTPSTQGPAPAPSATVASAEAASWASRLAAHLLRFRHYPPDAERRGIMGVVVLRFSVDAGGRVVASSLARSSGHDMLDEEAQEWLRRAQPLPAPPADKLAPAAVMVPLSFVLH